MQFLYSAFAIRTIPLNALGTITLTLASAATGAGALQGTYSYQVPIYYTWVERDMPCLGAYALGGIEPPTV